MSGRLPLHNSDSRDWSWPSTWLAEAAHHDNPAVAEYMERIALGGVDGMREYLRLREELGLDDE